MDGQVKFKIIMDAVKEGIDHALENSLSSVGDPLMIQAIAQMAGTRAARRAVEMYEEELKKNVRTNVVISSTLFGEDNDIAYHVNKELIDHGYLGDAKEFMFRCKGTIDYETLLNLAKEYVTIKEV